VARPKVDEAQRLAPLPVRATRLQIARLARVVESDSLPVPDHIRRALDYYLTAVEKQRNLPPLRMTATGEVVVDPQES
jgi:hypothetical protein